MATQDNNPPTIEDLAAGQRQLTELLTSFIEEQRKVNADTTRFIEEQREVNADTTRFIEEQREVNADTTRAQRLSAFIEEISNDLGVVKGGHARTEVLRKASLIATAMGYTYVKNLRRTEIEAIANKGPHLDAAELMSFRNADLIMEVRGQDPRTAIYIAVEVSYTVAKYDADRAIRNAGFLKDLTNREAHPAIAGVAILTDAKQQVDDGEVSWYEIPLRDLQPA
jgi:hypothetical protein